jgi:superfamily II DNA or RNA helicase
MATARHPKATFFVRGQLFSGLTSFAELESKIAALPDEKSRGDAFEVFAEAYLVTQRKYDAAQVWPHSSIPLDLLKNLGLTQQDQGVDGVLQTLLGQFNAYQIKFRTGRPALTWRELSTFIGLADSPHIHSRVLLTNCDELPAVINDRQGFFCIRGSDLDRLEAGDFRAMEAWLADAAFIAPKKSPLPHQTEALNALLPALQTHDRVSAIMACGTGKTLVALWVTEQLEANRVLILLPSLALLRQTLHEWLRETHLPSLAYLCVCSDSTVKEGIDALTTQQSDLDFQVSTDPASVRSFLDAPYAGVKMIFSTYQSASVVGAAMQSGEAFDFAVFDEAHKTAGREGRNFGFALEDKNLPIRKRLFVTATPRHYNPHDRDREGEAALVFSMDNPAVYGVQAYRLTFAEAARRGIICNYKVIISVITSEMVTNDLLSHGEVFVNGDSVRARQVANQIALRDAIEKYGVSKVFTFHKTVASAASFVADGSEGVRTHLPNFKTFHVNGSMSTARREHEMRDFRAATQAVVSNARCLTEGVDVPAVDMVAFLSPRRSRVDIVQATGRAMRRSPGKTTGYVLVPLYVELTAGESVEAAVNRAEFDEVWDVLQSIQEQDDVLSELIRQIGEQKGRGKGFNDSGFADRIDFGGPRLDLAALRAAVATHCLENLYSSWDMWFGKLKVFKERFGHCNVETDWEEDSALAGWVSAQRTRRNKGLLYPERIRLLDELGFVWDFQIQKAQATWMKWYHELETYVREHGNPHVVRSYANTKLASWVWIQRQRRKGTIKKNGETRDLMTTEQESLLDKLGFRWDAREEKWTEQFEELKRFKDQHGHCEAGQVEGEKSKLAAWVTVQRSNNSSGKLQTERKAKLDSIKFQWTAEGNELKWQEMYELLKTYHAEHGDADVPFRSKENRKLAAWVSHQRQRKKTGGLENKEICLLEALGFTWQHRERGSWGDRYQELIEFKAEHKHCNVPFDYEERPKLGGFVNSMRTKKSRGELSQQRIQLLDQIGFKWAVREEQSEEIWEARCKQLLEFKATHGHCNVPTEWSENPTLGHWLSVQRGLKRAGELDLEKEQCLDKLGIQWDRRSAQLAADPDENWTARYQQLLQFKERHGHCNVPYKWPDNPQLGGWIVRQRQWKKSGKLLPDRERRLNEIDFSWQEAERGDWEDRFQELVEFKAKHRHCDVPVVYPENSKLGSFTKNMRATRKEGTLSAEKFAKLDAIGFAWVSERKAIPPQMREAMQEPVTASWKKSYDELVAYQKAHGNCDVPVKWKENPQLGGWAAAQRSLRKSGKLHSERERMLNEIGFDWRADQNKEDWETRFGQLKDYKQRFGDCCVPVKWAENPRLGAWVSQQRHFQKGGKLSPEKERLLNEIGFARTEQPATTHGVNRAWNDWFEELVQYKAKHGDCKVPTKGNENPKLGVWVSNQRQSKKQGKLEPERERILNEIGFAWNLRSDVEAAS